MAITGQSRDGTSPHVRPQGPGSVRRVAARGGGPGGQGRLLLTPRNARGTGPEGKAGFGGVCAVGQLWRKHWGDRKNLYFGLALEICGAGSTLCSSSPQIHSHPELQNGA